MPSTKVRIKRPPLWRVEVQLRMKDGTEFARQNDFRFDPDAERGGSLLVNDPLDEAMDELLDAPEIKALDPSQLTEFNLNVKRI